MTLPDRSHEATFIEHIRAGKRANRQLAYVMFGMLVITWGAHALADFKLSTALAFSALFAVVGGIAFLASLGDPAQHVVLVTLRERPHEIVWGYVMTTLRYGKPSSSLLFLGLVNGKLLSVNAKIGQEEQLLGLLRRVAPQATLGFDAAHAKAFRQNPASLRRAA